MLSLNRRAFVGIGALAAGAAGAAALLRSPGTDPGVYLNLRGPPGYRGGVTDPQQIADLYDDYALVATDLATFAEIVVPVPFPAHGIASSARAPALAILVEKWGRHCAAVDYAAGTILAVDQATADRQYIGHAAFAPDDATIFVSEGHFPQTPDGYARGIIGVRDPRSLALIREFPSHGENPHECRLLSDGTTLAVCNQGTVNRFPPTATNLAFIDTRDGRLLEQLGIDRADVCIAHMRLLPDDRVIAVTKTIDNSPESNQLYVGGRGAGLASLRLGADRHYPTEILSIDIDAPRGRVGVTNPEGGRVTFVDLTSREVLATFERPGVLSIALTLDGRFWIVAGVSTPVWIIDAVSLEPDGELAPDEFQAEFFTAPHATVGRRTA
jgi:hypothetical protein